MKRVSLLAATLTCLACGGQVIIVNGIEVYEKIWSRTVADIGARTSFDLNCPADQVQYTLFSKQGRYPIQVGVEGCGKRASFVRVVTRDASGLNVAGPWQLNVVNEQSGSTNVVATPVQPLPAAPPARMAPGP